MDNSGSSLLQVDQKVLHKPVVILESPPINNDGDDVEVMEARLGDPLVMHTGLLEGVRPREFSIKIAKELSESGPEVDGLFPVLNRGRPGPPTRPQRPHRRKNMQSVINGEGGGGGARAGGRRNIRHRGRPSPAGPHPRLTTIDRRPGRPSFHHMGPPSMSSGLVTNSLLLS